MSRRMDFNEDGVLSIDFLAGFTIFILVLIMVISMLPGILAGIQSEAIDYDAVAYRTSVILVEDPGWPANPPWNQIDELHKADIERMGLALSKDTPNILSRGKIDLFFDNGAAFTMSEDDYRTKVIFGDIPYLYNFSLKIGDEDSLCVGPAEIPESSYGYQRRLVKVKEDSFGHIDFSDGRYISTNRVAWNGTEVTPFEASFFVDIEYGELYDRSISPAYRIDPRSDRLTFDMEEMLSKLDPELNDGMKLEEVRLYKIQDGGSTQILLYNWADWNNDTYIFYHKNNFSYEASKLLDASVFPLAIDNNTSLKMELIPSLPFSDEMTSGLRVNFTFSYNWTGANLVPGYTYLSGTHKYNYDVMNVDQPNLVDGVLEVAIW